MLLVKPIQFSKNIPNNVFIYIAQYQSADVTSNQGKKPDKTRFSFFLPPLVERVYSFCNINHGQLHIVEVC